MLLRPPQGSYIEMSSSYYIIKQREVALKLIAAITNEEMNSLMLLLTGVGQLWIVGRECRLARTG